MNATVEGRASAREQNKARLRITAAGGARAIQGESTSGDACEIFTWSRGVIAALADGLGHGPHAASASHAFMQCVRECLEQPLEDLFAHAQRMLLKTRGVVAALARFDEAEGTVEIAGLGNIGVQLARADSGRIERPILVPGVLGSSYRTARPQRYELALGDLLIMHSDGVRPRFDAAALRGLSAQQAVDSVLLAHGRSADDAACVIARAVQEHATVSRPVHLSQRPDAAVREIPVRERSDAECAALSARTFAESLGMPARAQWEVSIATSELATNIVKYGEHGVIRLRHEQTPRAALVVEAIDHGRGIANVEAAFSDGHSRGEKLSPDRDRSAQQGLGVGLGSVSRMMDSVDVNSRDHGTHIVAKKLIA